MEETTTAPPSMRMIIMMIGTVIDCAARIWEIFAGESIGINFSLKNVFSMRWIGSTMTSAAAVSAPPTRAVTSSRETARLTDRK